MYQKFDSYDLGLAEGLTFGLLPRSDRRRPGRLKCKPGYEQHGAACKPINRQGGKGKGGFKLPHQKLSKNHQKAVLKGALAGAAATGVIAAGATGAAYLASRRKK